MEKITTTRWQCSACGATVALQRGQTPTVWIRDRADTGSERLVIAGDLVVHRCGQSPQTQT